MGEEDRVSKEIWGPKLGGRYSVRKRVKVWFYIYWDLNLLF